ncbi:carboxypeptidase-like regulatory domain-containing protein [Mucilaginibacter sp.]|uniref:carboxypeptidase-like regulatory domain-containing protein n=1 Tax=Mucilaginibacter sp. TaxID=1882438 RepID=UPI003264E7AA
MKNFVLLVLIMAIGLSGFRTNDTRTITGTVISIDDNLPIPGATVKVKGTTIGTQTTTIGKFSLKVP